MFIMDFLRFIWDNDWTPHSLLEETKICGLRDYHSNPESCFLGYNFNIHWETYRTKFGKLIYKLPGILAFLFLIIYYILMGIIWFISTPTIGLIKFIICLFTKRWGDI